MRSRSDWGRSTAALVLLMTLFFVAPFGRDDPLPLAVSLLLVLVRVAGTRLESLRQRSKRA